MELRSTVETIDSGEDRPYLLFIIPENLEKVKVSHTLGGVGEWDPEERDTTLDVIRKTWKTVTRYTCSNTIPHVYYSLFKKTTFHFNRAFLILFVN